MKMIDNSIAKKGLRTIWGPISRAGVSPIGPQPPVNRSGDDNYEWGVGEEADFISFSPIFKPSQSGLTPTQDIRKLSRDGSDGNPLKEIPQRASAVTMSRLSKSLLNEMHLAQTQDPALSSEMAPSTVALWHGLKAVHVPHPIYVDGESTPKDPKSFIASINPFFPTRKTGTAKGIRRWSYLLDHVPFRVAFRLTAPTADTLFRRWMGQTIDTDKDSKGNIVSLPKIFEMQS